MMFRMRGASLLSMSNNLKETRLKCSVDYFKTQNIVHNGLIKSHILWYNKGG